MALAWTAALYGGREPVLRRPLRRPLGRKRLGGICRHYPCVRARRTAGARTWRGVSERICLSDDIDVYRYNDRSRCGDVTTTGLPTRRTHGRAARLGGLPRADRERSWGNHGHAPALHAARISLRDPTQLARKVYTNALAFMPLLAGAQLHTTRPAMAARAACWAVLSHDICVHSQQ